MGEKKISIVIVTYNSENVIFRCLDSVFKYNDIKDCIEVIVVDNNSQNQLQMFSDICRRYGNKVILLRNPQNGGYGQGNNIGIKASTAPVILIMNPDVSLFFPIFEKAVIHFSNLNVGILGMSQYESRLVRKQSFLSIFPSIKGLLYFKIYHWLNMYSSHFLCIHGACFFIKKSVIDEIGYFDENIFLYNEEMDIHYRLYSLKKYIIRYDRNLGYIHPMHERVETFEELKMRFGSYLYVCNKFGFSKKKVINKLIRLYKLYMVRSLLMQDKKMYHLYSSFSDYLILYKENV